MHWQSYTLSNSIEIWDLFSLFKSFLSVSFSVFLLCLISGLLFFPFWSCVPQRLLISYLFFFCSIYQECLLSLSFEIDLSTSALPCLPSFSQYSQVLIHAGANFCVRVSWSAHYVLLFILTFFPRLSLPTALCLPHIWSVWSNFYSLTRVFFRILWF